MKSLILHIVILLATCSLLSACTADTTCRQDLTVRMNVTLQGDSLNDKLHNVRYTSWDSITVQIVGEDSILLDNRKGFKQLPLFLHPSAPEINSALTAFAMTYHGQTDTL